MEYSRNMFTSRSKSKTNDMTQGRSMRHLVLFFLPLVMGNLFQQFYSVVDSLIVGKILGDKAIAAVGLTGSFNFFILGFVIGMTKGYGILFSQSFGKKDYEGLARYVASAVRLCLGISVAITILCVTFIKPVLYLVKTPGDIFADTYNYYVVILLGISVTVMNNLMLTILQSLGDSRRPLIAMIISSVTNIGLDLFFIIVLKMGVAGASIATVLAQVVSFLYCAGAAMNIPELKGAFGIKTPDGTDRSYYMDLLKMGFPVGFMNSVTAIGAMILQYFVNQMESGYIAAYSVCMKFAGLFEQIGVSVGLSVLTFVGQNFGAGKIDRIKKGVNSGLILATIVNLPLSSLMIFAPEQLTGLILNSPEYIGYCKEFLPILGICLYGLGWLFVYRYSVQGLGNTFVPMTSGFLEVAMRVGVGLVFARQSFRGVAYAEVSAWLGAFVMLMITYYVLMSGLYRKARTVLTW